MCYMNYLKLILITIYFLIIPERTMFATTFTAMASF